MSEDKPKDEDSGDFPGCKTVLLLVPQDTWVALHNMGQLLKMEDEELILEALYMHLPNLIERVDAITKARALPSIYPT